jgi:hypothetical protein
MCEVFRVTPDLIVLDNRCFYDGGDRVEPSLSRLRDA